MLRWIQKEILCPTANQNQQAVQTDG